MTEPPHFKATLGSSLDEFIRSLASGRVTLETPTFTRTLNITIPSTRGRGRPAGTSLMPQNQSLLEEMRSMVSSGASRTGAARAVKGDAANASEEAALKWLVTKYAEVYGK